MKNIMIPIISNIKKWSVCYWMLIFPFLFACTDDGLPQDKLNGRWNLLSLECCEGINETYGYNEIIWDIHVHSKTIRIINNRSFDDFTNYFFQENGLYEFMVNDSSITINFESHVYFFDYAVTKKQLMISNNPESDGPILKFKKMI